MDSINYQRTQQYSYGPLTNGMTAWGETNKHIHVSGTLTTGTNGSDSIDKFTYMLDNFPSVSYICFNPRRRKI
jgi:hypothetical protein